MKKLKFLFTALSVAATALTVLPSQAQIKTYLLEDFSKGLNPTLWNMDACTPISEDIGPLYYLQTTDGNVWGGWLNDPNGQIIGEKTDILEGSYDIVTNPIQLDDNVSNVVSMELMYDYMTAGTRSFSILVKAVEETTWSEVLKLSNNEMDGSIAAVLDPVYNGKEVELKFRFTTVKASAAYYLLMDDIKVAAYESVAALSTKVTASPVAYAGKEFRIKVNITNVGPVPVGSWEYCYTIDGIVKDFIQIDLDGELAPIVGLASGPIDLDMEGVETGEHELKMYLSKINGQAAAEGDTFVWKFITPDESLLSQAYMPLYEGFTSSTCAPCANANAALNPALDQLKNAGSINVIKYQMNFPSTGDPYYIAGNQTRMLFYDGVFGWNGYWGVPAPIYNGMEEIMEWEGQYWSDVANELKSRAADDHKRKATMDIDILTAEVAENGYLTLEFEVTPHLAVDGKVFAVVVEGTTTQNKRSNGEKEFHDVTMAFASGANGVAKSFEEGQKETFSYKTNMKNTKVEEMSDLKVVCFVQHESGYIFQSASAAVESDYQDPTANESLDVMGNIRVYPNPAAKFVNITNLENADVEIFDLTGRRVYANNSVNGDLQVSLTAFAEGTYVVRLTQDGQSVHRKLVVVK
ncbi:MAG: T9SS type A sorting domain-containing protein [Lentimicrobiaceae bacterium]|nr:T9SS type A sorting domain-containing protein [Lentimicrobiaceae bacterium]